MVKELGEIAGAAKAAGGSDLCHRQIRICQEGAGPLQTEGKEILEGGGVKLVPEDAVTFPAAAHSCLGQIRQGDFLPVMVIEEGKDRLNAGGGHFPLPMIAIIPCCF